MASIRERHRKDGSTYWDVRFRLDGAEISFSTETRKQAEAAQRLIDATGPKRAMDIFGIERTKREPGELTVEQWLERYIATLTGVERKTIDDYTRYAVRDINPVLGGIALSALSSEAVAGWVNAMAAAGSSGKTIANKHGFLSGALSAAVARGHLKANPGHGQRLPRTERREMIALTPREFQILRASFTDYYRPLVDFLVASGCRFSEAVALKPSDVNREECTVRIVRAWKFGKKGEYTIGAPKTQRSIRTIDIDKDILDALNYSREWLFVNTAGKPVRIYGWRENVWNKSVNKAMTKGFEGELLTRRPRIHDLRHTCATWMVQDNNPLPVVQQHLGHESIETTIRAYAHLDRASARRAAGSVSRAMRGQSTPPLPMK